MDARHAHVTQNFREAWDVIHPPGKFKEKKNQNFIIENYFLVNASA